MRARYQALPPDPLAELAERLRGSLSEADRKRLVALLA
jgi:hypothetical protein